MEKKDKMKEEKTVDQNREKEERKGGSEQRIHRAEKWQMRIFVRNEDEESGS